MFNLVGRLRVQRRCHSTSPGIRWLGPLGPANQHVYQYLHVVPFAWTSSRSLRRELIPFFSCERGSVMTGAMTHQIRKKPVWREGIADARWSGEKLTRNR